MAAHERPFERSGLVHSVAEDAQVVLGAMGYVTAEEALDIFLRFATTVPAGRNRAEQIVLADLLARIASRIAERFYGDTRSVHLSPQRITEELRRLSMCAPLVSTTNRRVRQFFICLRTRYSCTGLTAREVAKELGISVWHLARLLHEHTGHSFRDHLRTMRINVSKHLLLTSALSIKEIAGIVGYSSVSVLDHDFKRACGQSPSMFRMAATSDVQVRFHPDNPAT